MTVLTELTQRLSRLFLAPNIALDYERQELALREALKGFVTCKRRKILDQLLDILELLPQFFLSPSLYYSQFDGDWSETLPGSYEQIRAFLDENWNALYSELKDSGESEELAAAS
jgi:hypothetical protein